MSANTGDRSRYHRLRKQKINKRARMRVFAAELKTKATAAAVAAAAAK